MRRGTAARALLSLVVAAATLVVAGSRLAPPGDSRPNGSIAPGARWFEPSSPLNTPIPADARVDPRSPAMVAGLVHMADTKGWPLSVGRWTVPVYYARRATPRVRVRLTASWRPRTWMTGVPIPAVARPDPSHDAHMAVLDLARGCFYEFYGAERGADGSWRARWANRGSLRGTGIQPAGLSTRASGFANFAGLVRPSELAAGVIPHALVFGHPYTKAGGPVRPATASDGRPESESGAATGTPRPDGVLPIPIGAHVQLDPSLDLDALSLAPWQRVVARALQVYGMYLGDTAGTISLNAVAAQSWEGNPYARTLGREPYAYLPPALARHLRVLELPAQQDLPTRVVPSACARMR